MHVKNRREVVKYVEQVFIDLLFSDILLLFAIAIIVMYNTGFDQLKWLVVFAIAVVKYFADIVDARRAVKRVREAVECKIDR